MKELSSINNIQPISTGGLGKPSLRNAGGDEFSKTSEKTLQGDALKETKSAKAIQPIDFKFSNHAVERMRTRGIVFNQSQMQDIQSAFQRAEAKGSKEALIVSDDSAMVASIKNKTIVTVLDKAALRENVFTNIDSTVFI